MKQVIYVHAVSVGEVFIALKLINRWLEQQPDLRVVLAVTTSTGHAVAREAGLNNVRVIYSPLDFVWTVRAVMRRFKPRQIVLIESEMWPNLLNCARRMEIPVVMVNARLSQRSEARVKKFSKLVQPLYAMVDLVCVQNEDDARRIASIGVTPGKIRVTGSIKFDPSGGAAPEKRAEFQAILDDFAEGVDSHRRVVLLASTHSGEEKLLGEAFTRSESGALLLVVPRHAERRDEVVTDLQACGYEVVLRSRYQPPRDVTKACLVVDTTGELCDWTAHADVVVIGKSWLAEGGQNPAEAIAAGVPVVTGPNMDNFEPLISMLKRAGGIRMLESADVLPEVLDDLLGDAQAASRMCHQAAEVLGSHEQAVQKTIELLHLNASVASRNM